MTQQYDPRVHEDDWSDHKPDLNVGQEYLNLVNRTLEARALLIDYGQTDGAHHLRWVVDQAVRILAGPDYDRLIAEYCDGEDGPETYEWDTGVAP